MDCPQCKRKGKKVEMEEKIDPQSGGCAQCPKCGYVIDLEDDEWW